MAKKHQYWVKAKFTYRGYVIVEAINEEEAQQKAENCCWLDETPDDLEDWEITGEPILNE